MKDCQKCRTYKKCLGHSSLVKTKEGQEWVSWYNYGEIRFCPLQVKWIIENSVILESGDWPPDPDDKSLKDWGKPSYASEGYFVKSVGILGEVEYRRARTGTAGKLLKAEVAASLELSEESQSALMYIKGWRRKKQNYNEWKKKPKYRAKCLPKGGHTTGQRNGGKK